MEFSYLFTLLISFWLIVQDLSTCMHFPTRMIHPSPLQVACPLLIGLFLTLLSNLLWNIISISNNQDLPCVFLAIQIAPINHNITSNAFLSKAPMSISGLFYSFNIRHGCHSSIMHKTTNYSH